MLWETLTALLTPCPPAARKLGYRREFIAIMARAQRCQAAWALHQQFCVDGISAVIKAHHGALIPPYSPRVIVFGAGLIFDLPLRQLSADFKEVLLVDLLFARQTLQLARSLGNVRCITLDVCGVVAALAHTPKSALAKGPLPLPCCDFMLASPPKPTNGRLEDFSLLRICRGDLVISLNILSQLPLLPCRWLALHIKSPPLRLRAYKKLLQDAHLDYLKRLWAKGAALCILSDVCHDYYDRHNRLIESQEMLEGLTLPSGQVLGNSVQDWQWELAPFGEVSRHYRLRARVKLVYLPQPA
jgi:hypothetical protein